MPTDSELLTTTEVAAILRVTNRTVTNWAKTGELHGVQINGKRWRFWHKDVLAFLERESVS